MTIVWLAGNKVFASNDGPLVWHGLDNWGVTYERSFCPYWAVTPRTEGCETVGALVRAAMSDATTDVVWNLLLRSGWIGWHYCCACWTVQIPFGHDTIEYSGDTRQELSPQIHLLPTSFR